MLSHNIIHRRTNLHMRPCSQAPARTADCCESCRPAVDERPPYGGRDLRSTDHRCLVAASSDAHTQPIARPPDSHGDAGQCPSLCPTMPAQCPRLSQGRLAPASSSTLSFQALRIRETRRPLRTSRSSTAAEPHQRRCNTHVLYCMRLNRSICRRWQASLAAGEGGNIRQQRKVSPYRNMVGYGELEILRHTSH